MTSDERAAAGAGSERADWNVPRPESIPRPTYAPAALAFGITFLLGGLVLSPVVIAAGLVVIIASLTVWIGEIRHEG